MTLDVVIPPATEPVSLDEARAFCRVDSDHEDVLLTALITAAREQVEVMTGRALADQTLRMTRAPAPRERVVMLPRHPAIEVIEVSSGGEVLGEWEAVTDSVPGVVLYPHPWPHGGPVSITFRCGYGAVDEDGKALTPACPERARHAIRFLVGHWYEERQPAVVGRSVINVPWTVESLVRPLKTWVRR